MDWGKCVSGRSVCSVKTSGLDLETCNMLEWTCPLDMLQEVVTATCPGRFVQFLSVIDLISSGLRSPVFLSCYQERRTRAHKTAGS